MKSYLSLILALALVSCQSEAERKSDASYAKGIEILRSGNANWNEALTYFSEATRLDPDNILAHYWKAGTELNLGKTNEAFETIATTLKNPEIDGHKIESKMLLMAGVVSNELGQASDAYLLKTLDLYETALEQNEQSIGTILDKARILCYLNRKDEATEFISSFSLQGDDQKALDAFQKNIPDLDLPSVSDYMGG